MDPPGALEYLGGHLTEGGKARPLGGHLHGGLLGHRRTAADPDSVDIVLHGDVEPPGLNLHVDLVHIGGIGAVQAVFSVLWLQDVEEDLVLLSKPYPKAVFQEIQNRHILRWSYYQARLIAAQPRHDIGVEAPLLTRNFHFFLKQPRDQTTLGIGMVHLQSAHISGKLLDFQHKAYLLSMLHPRLEWGGEAYSQNMGNTVIIQPAETTQRMVAGMMDCLMRDFKS